MGSSGCHREAQMLSTSTKTGCSRLHFPLEELSRGPRTDHLGNGAQCQRGGEAGMAGRPFTRGQHHANKNCLKSLRFWISQVGAGTDLHTLGNLAWKVLLPKAAERGARGRFCFRAWEGAGKRAQGWGSPAPPDLFATSGNCF